MLTETRTRSRRMVAVTAALGAILASCTAAKDDGSGSTPDGRIRIASEAVALRSFDDCVEVLDYFKDHAVANVGPYGLPWSGGGAVALEFDAFQRAADSAAAPSAESPGSPTYSTTNIQEAGVDEPDTVKTDGRIVFTMSGNRLMAVDVSSGRARLADTMTFDDTWAGELLLAGDRLLVLSRNGAIAYAEPALRDAPAPGISVPSPAPEQWRGRTSIRVIDVSDPARMRRLETLWVEGDYVSARLIDGVARIVLRTGGVAIPMEPPAEPTAAAAQAAVRANRARINASTLTDWLPRYAIAADATVPADGERPLVGCDSVKRPAEFSGTDMVTVLTVDPADPKPDRAETIVGTGETVYATAGSLYVTTAKWEPIDLPSRVSPDSGISSDDVIAPPVVNTQIHRFDISDPKSARYTASGEVRGTVLNQWSLSEHDGHLRIATTRHERESVSEVTILRERGDALERVGRVGGLGKTERIYAVRYMGDLAYVVTFRQVDPLYVLDLSDPERPRVRGELKIPGFSAYLHPLGEGRLLGIGQDADDQGRALGVQASVFDVSDPDDPRQVDKIVLGAGHTPVQEDHRAFLWWQPSRSAVFPLNTWDEVDQARSGAAALRVGRDGSIRDLGRVAHPSVQGIGAPGIERALVIGDALVTVSQGGVMLSDLGSLDRRDWLRFPTA